MTSEKTKDMPRSARRASELSCTLLPSWLSRICSIWTQALRLSCIGLLLKVVGLSPLIDLRLGLDQSVVSVERDTSRPLVLILFLKLTH